MIGVYKITNTKNGKIYIGQSKDIEQRWKQHRRMLELRTHHSTKLQKDYNRYGKDCFTYEIIETTDEEFNLDDLEMKYIKEYNSLEVGYNMIGLDSDGKYTTQKKLTKRQKDKMRKEEYDNFINATKLFDGNLVIEDKTYRDRLIEQHYGYSHYRRIVKLLTLTYNNFYNEGGIVRLDFFFGSIRITNMTHGRVIITCKKSNKINVWEENTGLLLKDAQTYKVEDLLR